MPVSPDLRGSQPDQLLAGLSIGQDRQWPVEIDPGSLESDDLADAGAAEEVDIGGSAATSP